MIGHPTRSPNNAVNEQRIEQLAIALVQARQSGTKLAALPDELKPASMAEAFAVQMRVMKLLGTTAAAWKAGTPFGSPPTRAPIFRELLVPSGSTLDASRHPMLIMEAEIGFWLTADLPPRTKPYSREEVAGAVGQACAAIEVADSRLANFYQAPMPDRVADNVGNGAVVAGSGQLDWQNIDFEQIQVSLQTAGVERVARRGGHPNGDPLVPLIWLANHPADNTGLCAGQFIITGSWTGMTAARAGDEVRVVFENIGEAAVTMQ